MKSGQHAAAQPRGRNRRPGLVLLFLGGTIAFQTGCSAIKNYSISSYPGGSLPVSEQKYVDLNQDHTKFGYPAYK